MKTYSFLKSQELLARAKRVIAGSAAAPEGGLYGHYSFSLSSIENPIYFSKAKGAKFWDIDGNEYVDYMCAYGPMILGYGHPKVDEAARTQLQLGDTVSLLSPVMIELAETLTDMVPIADWAFFAKNGADVTNLSIMVARAATGRKKILTIEGGYHGSSPWMQDSGAPGTIAEDTDNVLKIPWNDADKFETLVSGHRGEIAAFISSPYHHPIFEDNSLPETGFWQKVEQICRQNDIVLIVDDVRAGFRSNLAGSNETFGFKPDLICFGKALGNGYPISALVGTEALADAVSQVFHTGTMFFGAAPMAAAVATLKELKAIDGANLVNEIGQKVTDGMAKIAENYGYHLKTSGVPSMPYFRITNDESLALHMDWIAECVKRGIYMVFYHNHFISTAITDADLDRTWDIVDDAFNALKTKYGDSF